MGGADAQRGYMNTASVQDLHRGLETLAFQFRSADNRRRGNVDIVENHIGSQSAALPHLLISRADRDALQVGIDQKCGNPFGTFAVGSAARHYREDAGIRCIGDVTFGAVDDVSLSLIHISEPTRLGMISY